MQINLRKKYCLKLKKHGKKAKDLRRYNRIYFRKKILMGRLLNKLIFQQI